MLSQFHKFFFHTLICCGICYGLFSGTAKVVLLADEPAAKPTQLEKLTVIISGEALQQEKIHEWAGKASQLVTTWYPKIEMLLQSDGFTPPKEITIVFRKMDGVAYTTGNIINISAHWIHQHPDDFGMVAHELVHIIQSYPQHTGPSWVTEGIADYIRHAHYEPDVKLPKINPDRASYRDAYKTT
ncbi:MAG: basic secretory family protein, partial [Planctomycetaceae bacterium]|nr:basic secretory family protein [Planctomycetaceae bacterium]